MHYLCALTCKRTKFEPILRGTCHKLPLIGSVPEKILQSGGSIFLLPTSEQRVSLRACKCPLNRQNLKRKGVQHHQHLIGCGSGLDFQFPADVACYIHTTVQCRLFRTSRLP